MLAWNNKYVNKDGDPAEESHYFKVICFGDLADNVSESVSQKMRVVVVGKLNHRQWRDDDGKRQNAVDLIADEVSPSLRYARAKVERNPHNGNGGF